MDTKIKLMQEDDAGNIWVDSLISCCIPNCDVMPSLLLSSSDVLSSSYHLCNFALRSPRRTIKKGLFFSIVSKLSSTLSANVPNSSRDI